MRAFEWATDGKSNKVCFAAVLEEAQQTNIYRRKIYKLWDLEMSSNLFYIPTELFRKLKIICGTEFLVKT
jgi:hypothetical protein